MNYIVIGKGFVSPEFVTLGYIKNFLCITTKELTNFHITLKPSDKVYISSEDALQAVLEKTTSKKRREMISLLKDKFACRQLLKSLYPSFYFSETTVKGLASITLDRQKKYVVKPKKGFFNVGVKTIDKTTNLKQLTTDIQQELTANTKYFSDAVLSSTELLIEEYIEGTEFAVDMYYSSTGKPIILNIYHHPFPKNNAYFNVVYYTSREIFKKYEKPLLAIFAKLNQKLRATSLPLHAEFKLTQNTFIPIEFNPMRFGGMGLADLTYYSYGVNPFLAFFTDMEPDWEKIWQEKKDTYFAWVLGYIGTNSNIKNQHPNHEKFQKVLGKTLHYNQLDYHKLPLFANAYVACNKKKINQFLALDFNRFFDK